MQNEELVCSLLDTGVIKFGEFKLKSGIISPIYIDLRILISSPKVLRQVASAYVPLLEKLTYDRMVAIPYAALPIASAISFLNNKPWLYTRKEVKDYGTKKKIEGEYKTGEQVVVIDDLITTGASKFEVIAPIKEAGLIVKDIVVLIDRGQGGKEELLGKGYHLHAVLTLKEILETLKKKKKISQDIYNKVMAFLSKNSS